MSELVRTVTVNCPVNQAQRHIDTYFDQHTAAAADGAERVSLVMLKAPGFPGGAILQRQVEVQVVRHEHALDAFDTMGVDWEVPGGSMYPKFHGTLNVEGEDDYNSFRLALRGSYDPPGGVVGEIFDVAIGHRIAEATASTLLDEIRDSVERSYHEVEAGKRTDPAQPA